MALSLVHCFIPQPLIAHLLWARHCPRHWGSSGHQDRPKVRPCGAYIPEWIWVWKESIIICCQTTQVGGQDLWDPASNQNCFPERTLSCEKDNTGPVMACAHLTESLWCPRIFLESRKITTGEVLGGNWGGEAILAPDLPQSVMWLLGIDCPLRASATSSVNVMCACVRRDALRRPLQLWWTGSL